MAKAVSIWIERLFNSQADPCTAELATLASLLLLVHTQSPAICPQCFCRATLPRCLAHWAAAVPQTEDCWAGL